MRSSYLTAGITLSGLSRLTRRNTISYKPKFLLRLLFLYQSSLWSSVFAFIEHKRIGSKIQSTPLPEKPVFIIGHWRTGSTMLHKLMSLDPHLAAPTLFDVAEPDSFLTSYNYYKPVMKLMISRHRPMDNVVLGMDEPQEDEYAIYRISDFSPLEKLVFPKEKKYFLNDADFLPCEEVSADWQEKIKMFHKKLFLKYKRNIVFKNPFNSLRIKLLLELFPEARFINIVRHPYKVVPSSVNMWKIVQRQNALNDNYCCPTIAEVSTVMARLMDRISQDSKLIPREHYAEIHFEALEKDPVGEIRILYEKIDIPFTPEFEKNLVKYLSVNSRFEKNRFSLSEAEKKEISGILGKQMSHYSYIS